MNWPGGQFFAPESLLDGKGRRLIWAWVTDPRTIPPSSRPARACRASPACWASPRTGR